MRLVPFASGGPAGRRRHLGAIVDGDADNGILLDLTAATRCVFASRGASVTGADRLASALVPPDVVALAENGEAALDAARDAVEQATREGWETDPLGAKLRWTVGEITRLPAVSDPPLLRDFLAFEQHLRNIYPRLGREIPQEWYQLPTYYKGNPSAVGAHEDDIPIPTYASRIDLEFEFAAVIGTGGRDIDPEDALDHVLGWCVYDDFSARDVQAKEMAVGLGPAKGKDFVRGHVLGPALVTADEVPDIYDLRFESRINGQVWTQGTTADMHWRFEFLIAHASAGEIVRAGEVFGSGTVPGGSGAEQDRFLAGGDVVELEVERLGVLRNRVVESPPRPVRGPRGGRGRS